MKSNKKAVKKRAQDKKFSKISKKQDMALKIVLILLIVIAIILLVLRYVNGKNLSSNNKTVKELYNYLVTDDLNDCDGLVNYTNEKVKYSDIADDLKLCIAYKKTDIKNRKVKEYNQEKKEKICKIDDMIFKADNDTTKCKVTIFNKKYIENTYNKLFGKEMPAKESFNYGDSYICYLKDDNYYCGLSEVTTYSLEGESSIYRIIEKAVEKGSTLTIYDYFLKINSDICYKYYTPLNGYEINECTKNYKNAKINYKFMEKYGTLYKHIYQKDKNGNYYWVSSTPIEKS